MREGNEENSKQKISFAHHMLRYSNSNLYTLTGRGRESKTTTTIAPEATTTVIDERSPTGGGGCGRSNNSTT